MKKKFPFALILTAVFLFYRVEAVVAMAAEQNPELIVETPSEQIEEPEQTEESDAEPEQTGESDAEAEPEQAGESGTKPKAEQTEESDAEPEQTEESNMEAGPEEIEDSVIVAEPMSIMETMANAEAEQITESTVEAEPETVSTGDALIEWLESHRSTGGMVKLANHIVLEDDYSFVSDGPNSPDIFIDADQYTITITGQVEFLSNNKLIFLGRPDDKSIFYVAEKGTLSIYGISVESTQYALWQEEGAGLEISECSISGSVHYADQSFVMYCQNFICAVVEKGQTAGDVLPQQIRCSVNHQGQVSNNEWVCVSWNLEGTEVQQEQRQRFTVQGSFLGAASAEPALCTVVYNDYPLTFTDVSASVSGDIYTFFGGFTAPEEALPFTVMAEYSFDGENWLLFEEQRAINTNASFYISIRVKQRSMEEYSNIYIRLQWNDNGTRYFSNVLCYAMDNLEQLKNIGGSRGGGTSILDPAASPQQSVDDISSVNAGADQNQNRNTALDKDKSEASHNDSYSEDENIMSGPTVADDETPKTIIPKMSVVQAAGAKPQAENAKEQTVDAESQAENTTERIADTEYSESQTFCAEQSSYMEAKPQNEINLYYSDSEIPTKNKGAVLILVAAGFALLSGLAGTVGFYIHFRSGTNK